MTRQIGANYVARGNGAVAPPARPFREEAPTPTRWAEAVSILAAGLAEVVRSPDRAATTATATLIRAGEAVPAALRSAEVRAALAISAAVAEARPVPVAPVVVPQPPAAPAPTPVALPDPLGRNPPAPLGVHELQARLAMLEQRLAAARARGDKSNARTVKTSMNQTRKRLRVLLTEGQER